MSSFAGRFVQWRDMLVAPRAVQRPTPPIWIGGNSAAAAALAGRLGDGWIPWRIDRARFAERLAQVSAARPPDPPRQPFTAIAPLAAGRVEDRAQLLAEIAAWRAAGATGFHVSFRHRSCADLLALLDRFAGEVVSRCRAG